MANASTTKGNKKPKVTYKVTNDQWISATYLNSDVRAEDGKNLNISSFQPQKIAQLKIS